MSAKMGEDRVGYDRHTHTCLEQLTKNPVFGWSVAVKILKAYLRLQQRNGGRGELLFRPGAWWRTSCYNGSVILTTWMVTALVTRKDRSEKHAAPPPRFVVIPGRVSVTVITFRMLVGRFCSDWWEPASPACRCTGGRAMQIGEYEEIWFYKAISITRLIVKPGPY